MTSDPEESVRLQGYGEMTLRTGAHGRVPDGGAGGAEVTTPTRDASTADRPRQGPQARFDQGDILIDLRD
ncbi:hypothetical protein FXV83_22580 [Bradyrhizobium hipponense]|uniref:Uncharacterized protein n=1 Tax=Bradyrhizobium hipponense TaxID=2605638 RepID=A0A5S4YID0_9BRAD|nr:hypothetical protein FXV83_22580 [Bradyrhizobium hipponense]